MTTLTGGLFQNAFGQPLANGFLLLTLSADAQAPGGGQVTAAQIRVPLNAQGSVIPTSVYASADLTPNSTFYIVEVHAADGTLQSSPRQLKLVVPSGSTYDLGTWIPGSV